MSKSVAVRVDDELKRQAESMLDEIGLNMTTYITSSLKALVREKGVPFELTISQNSNERYLAKLDDAMDDLINNGGYEYLGKDAKGNAVFSDTPTKAAV